MINGEFYKVVAAISGKVTGWLQVGVCYSMKPEKYVKDIDEDVMRVFVDDITALLDDIVPRTPVVTVEPMTTSAGIDYFVQIKVGDRTTTPFSFRDEEFKAQYEAAHLRYIFTGGKQPDLMDYDEDKWPGKDD